jgi:quinol monooxygenase YgiN
LSAMPHASLTAVIRCKPDAVETVLEALIAVGQYAKAHEPGTLGYIVVRSAEDPMVLITQELFADQAAMQAHNEGPGSKAFFAAAEGLIEDVVIHTGAVEHRL